MTVHVTLVSVAGQKSGYSVGNGTIMLGGRLAFTRLWQLFFSRILSDRFWRERTNNCHQTWQQSQRWSEVCSNSTWLVSVGFQNTSATSDTTLPSRVVIVTFLAFSSWNWFCKLISSNIFFLSNLFNALQTSLLFQQIATHVFLRLENTDKKRPLKDVDDALQMVGGTGNFHGTKLPMAEGTGICCQQGSVRSNFFKAPVGDLGGLPLGQEPSLQRHQIEIGQDCESTEARNWKHGKFSRDCRAFMSFS